MTVIQELSELPVDEKHLWDGSVSGGEAFRDNFGVLSKFAFVDVLNRVLVPEAAKRVIWRVGSGENVVFFPCYLEKKARRLLGWTELKPICDLYPGRSAAAVTVGGDRECLALLDSVFDAQKRWDSFSLTVLAGGRMEEHILAISGQRKIEPFVDFVLEYPYIELPDQWDDLYGSYAKKFRYNIRNSTKLLKELGDLELVQFTEQKEVPQFLSDVYSIERSSWKEAAGTSLTANKKQEDFHSELASIAAATGIFKGYILYLNGAPIAHVFGVLSDGVFYSLKLSYSEEYRKYSSGIVITSLVIQKLILEHVKFWDFSGPTEDYKRRWTSNAYSLRTLTFFSKNSRGQFLKMKRKIKGLISS